MKRFVFMIQDVKKDFNPRIVEVVDHDSKAKIEDVEILADSLVKGSPDSDYVCILDEVKSAEITKYDSMVSDLKSVYDKHRPQRKPESQIRGQVSFDDLLHVIAMMS